MATPGCPDWCALLAAAQDAYLKLLSGTAIVEFRDQNGEQIKYQTQDADKLFSRIEGLRRLCDPCYGRYSRPRAIGFYF